MDFFTFHEQETVYKVGSNLQIVKHMMVFRKSIGTQAKLIMRTRNGNLFFWGREKWTEGRPIGNIEDVYTDGPQYEADVRRGFLCDHANKQGSFKFNDYNSVCQTEIWQPLKAPNR